MRQSETAREERQGEAEKERDFWMDALCMKSTKQTLANVVDELTQISRVREPLKGCNEASCEWTRQQREENDRHTLRHIHTHIDTHTHTHTHTHMIDRHTRGFYPPKKVIDMSMHSPYSYSDMQKEKAITP